MFVESMAFAEIRKEFEKDRKYLYMKVAKHMHKEHSEMRRFKMSIRNKEYTYRTPGKNIWNYQFSLKYPRIKDSRFSEVYCLFYTEKSYRVVIHATLVDHLQVYSGHFFSRYFQRKQIKTDDVRGTIKEYFRVNPQLAIQCLKHMGENVWQMFGQAKDGVVLGYWYEALHLADIRTYIRNDMLFDFQKELSKQLQERFSELIVEKGDGFQET